MKYRCVKDKGSLSAGNNVSPALHDDLMSAVKFFDIEQSYQSDKFSLRSSWSDGKLSFFSSKTEYEDSNDGWRKTRTLHVLEFRMWIEEVPE